MKLFGSQNRSYDWSWLQKDKDFLKATFKDQSGERYYIYINQNDVVSLLMDEVDRKNFQHHDIWEFSFFSEYSDTLSPKKDYIMIMATIVAVARRGFECIVSKTENDIAVFFTAKDDSRQKLYKRLAGRLLEYPSYGFIKNRADEMYYIGEPDF